MEAVERRPVTEWAVRLKMKMQGLVQQSPTKRENGRSELEMVNGVEECGGICVVGKKCLGLRSGKWKVLRAEAGCDFGS